MLRDLTPYLNEFFEEMKDELFYQIEEWEDNSAGKILAHLKDDPRNSKEDCQRAMGDVLGFKYWAILQLDARFPNLKIIERANLPRQLPSALDLYFLRGDVLMSLVQRSDPEKVKRQNEIYRVTGRDLINLTTEEVVEDFLSNHLAQ